ncbi:MAG: hypothetical protein ACFCU9_12795, partial [Cyanophyceae cyanobacterium]
AKEVAERQEREQEELANNPPVEVSEEVAEAEPVDSTPDQPSEEPQLEEFASQPTAETDQDEAEQPPVQA